MLEAIINAGFQVTVLSRKESTQTFPSTVTVKHVDYSSVDSLTEALQGQDAVVSTIGGHGLSQQIPLVEAAAKAGVKRFLPSEFGSNTFNENASQLPAYQQKVEVQKALAKAASESGLTWTAVMCGPFFDWGIETGFLANPKTRTLELPDGGENKFSASTLATVGKAVVAVLRNPEQTKNRQVFVQDLALTQKELAALLKKAVGAEGWTETVTSIQEKIQEGYEEIKKENGNFWVFLFASLRAAIWGAGYGGHFEKLDNELLGIKQLTPDEVEAVVKKSVAKAQATL